MIGLSILKGHIFNFNESGLIFNFNTFYLFHKTLSKVSLDHFFHPLPLLLDDNNWKEKRIVFAIIEVERGKFRGVENTAAELDCAPAAGSAGVCGKEKWRENKWIEERKKNLT